MSTTAASTANVSNNLSGLERYKKLKRIGEGTYGIVSKGVDLNNNAFVAMKRIRLDEEDEGIPSTAIREISILKELNHVNVVELIDVVHHESKLHLIFEFLDQDLHNYMKTTPKSDPAVVKSYTQQLLMGIEFCHAHRVLHRDLST